MDIVLERDGVTCIYCRGETTTSTRVAHVFPQCIIQNDRVLPSGVECDKCNQFHGKLEQAMLNHNRIGVPAIVLGIPGKRGRPRRGHGSIERDAAGNVHCREVAKVASFSYGKLELECPDIAPLDEDRFRRALCHIALNYVAYEAGAAVALETRFDSVRAYVRRGSGPAWPYAQFKHPDQPIRSNLGCRRFRAEVNSIVQVRTYVDDFYVDLEARSDFLSTWANRTLPRGWMLA